jgi:ABC-type uncharacterized transport system fused permease/ATPase subunit
VGSVNFPTMARTVQDLVKHFVRVVLSTRRGKTLIVIWTGFLGWTAMGAPSPLLYFQNTAVPKSEGRQGRPTRKEVNDSLKPFVNLLRANVSGKFGITILVYVAALVGKIKITTILARLSGEMAGLLSARAFDHMFHNQVRFGLWCMLAASWTQLMKYLEKMVAAAVRTIIYSNLHEIYFDEEKLTLYRNQLEDTASRLSGDVREFSDQLAHTFGHVLKPCIDIAYLSYDLSVEIGPFPLVTFFGFFYLTKQALAAVRKGLPNSLQWYTSEEQRKEAQLSEHHFAIHDYREEISFLGGIEREKDIAMKKFRTVVDHRINSAASFGIVGMLNTYVLKYGGAMCAFSVLIPSVYSDESSSQQQITSNYLFQASLLGALAEAVKDLTSSISCWSEVLGHADRLFGLLANLEVNVRRCAQPRGHLGEDCNHDILLKLENVNIVDPKNKENIIAGNLNLTVRRGEDTMIWGVNGVGKTSLFRTIAGLWDAPSHDGSRNGTNGIQVNLSKSLFVPQRAYFMRSASLRDQVTYPQAGSFEEDDRILSLLKSVQLEELTLRYKLDDVEDWTNLLSGGQKQRVVWARVLYHQPDIVFLDEATAAINESSLHQLYRLIKENGHTTIVAISHNTSEKSFFHQVVKMEKCGFNALN